MKKFRVRRILVPIDFSKMSILAIETAKRLAQRFEATIDLVHVYELDYPAGFIAPAPPLMPYPVVAYDAGAERKIGERLRALAAQYDLPNEACHVGSGAPAFDEICRLARELMANLIVLPTHGYTGLKHVFLGSTAERVIQHSPCPVFVARERGKKRSRISSSGSINSILVPVDFSQCSFQALEYAIEFAGQVAARLIVFHAVHLGYALTADGYGMYDLSAVQEAARKDAERQMDESLRLAKFRGVKFETVIKDGPPVSEICEFAEQRDVDLIITATHGRTGFKHLLIGSVAEQIVRYAHRPVLVVPSHPEVRAALSTRAPRRARQPKGRSAKRKTLLIASERAKKDRRLIPHPFPERRKTNKFRESHSS